MSTTFCSIPSFLGVCVTEIGSEATSQYTFHHTLVRVPWSIGAVVSKFKDGIGANQSWIARCSSLSLAQTLIFEDSCTYKAALPHWHRPRIELGVFLFLTVAFHLSKIFSIGYIHWNYSFTVKEILESPCLCIQHLVIIKLLLQHFRLFEGWYFLQFTVALYLSILHTH